MRKIKPGYLMPKTPIPEGYIPVTEYAWKYRTSISTVYRKINTKELDSMYLNGLTHVEDKPFKR